MGADQTPEDNGQVAAFPFGECHPRQGSLPGTPSLQLRSAALGGRRIIVGVAFRGSQLDLCPREVIFSDTPIKAAKER
jgi:hypothetical protein